jgi:hypothetical protein
VLGGISPDWLNLQTPNELELARREVAEIVLRVVLDTS